MYQAITFAFASGLLVGLSRQLNGRLSQFTSPLISSFWNHIVGFALLCLFGAIVGGLFLPGWSETPWWAYLGGPVGVVFIAAGSWLISKIGATQSALLVIAGQMISGVAFDYARGAPMSLPASAIGVLLIIGGVMLTQKER